MVQTRSSLVQRLQRDSSVVLRCISKLSRSNDAVQTEISQLNPCSQAKQLIMTEQLQQSRNQTVVMESQADEARKAVSVLQGELSELETHVEGIGLEHTQVQQQLGGLIGGGRSGAELTLACAMVSKLSNWKTLVGEDGKSVCVSWAARNGVRVQVNVVLDQDFGIQAFEVALTARCCSWTAVFT